MNNAMTLVTPKRAECPLHGLSLRRSKCRTCNAAYMRHYLRRRRQEHPDLDAWERARRRAKRRGVPFALQRDAISIPSECPVLGIPLVVGRARSMNSPSLDRIRPEVGYVPGNVRVISDRANRLKGELGRRQIAERARSGRADLREDYARIAAYLEREALLEEVRRKAAQGGRMAEEWNRIAIFLERAFRGRKLGTT